MTEGTLVFILPPDKHRPSFNTFYGRETFGSGDMSGPSGPTCLVKPNGEVRLFEAGTILDVKAVLARAPYEIGLEELHGVYYRE